MYVLLILGTLFTLVVALVVLRLFWPRLSPRTHQACITVAIALFILSAVSSLTHWRLSNGTLDSLLMWSRDLSYVFFALLFTLVRPRWLTSLIAIVLIVPVFSTSIILPLGELFAFGSAKIVDLGDHLHSQTVPFVYPQHASGVDIEVFQRMPWMPMLEKRVATTRLFNSQCNADKSFTVVERDSQPGRIVFHCPAWPGQSSGGDHLFIYPLH